MRVLPSGTTALLVELDTLDDVLALYAALLDRWPEGVQDIVPAARTLLVVTDPAATTPAEAEASRLRESPAGRVILRRLIQEVGSLVGDLTFAGDKGVIEPTPPADLPTAPEASQPAE